MLDLGFEQVRVRCHDDLARIEVHRAEQVRLLEETISAEVVAALTACGFQHITLDLQGYRMSSFNITPTAE